MAAWQGVPTSCCFLLPILSLNAWSVVRLCTRWSEIIQLGECANFFSPLLQFLPSYISIQPGLLRPKKAYVQGGERPSFVANLSVPGRHREGEGVV